VKEINRRWDITFLIVEQKVHEILEIADRIFVLKDGRAVWETKTDGLQSEELKRFYLPPSRELK
jgi:ABC-type branched-subunit amino acid transport system ATPase component